MKICNRCWAANDVKPARHSVDIDMGLTVVDLCEECMTEVHAMIAEPTIAAPPPKRRGRPRKDAN